jgi:adenylate kinase family enzyme
MNKIYSLDRIYIIGPEGSGKSTLANIISKKLKIKHYDLDNVVWSRRYDKKRSHNARLNKLISITKKKKWIIEGIFGGWTEPAFKNSDLVIILNLDYSVLVKNLLKRAFIGRFTGFEKAKTNLKNTLKVIKHVKLYRTRDHEKSYNGHMKMIKKYKAKFIEIKNKSQLNKLILDLKES